MGGTRDRRRAPFALAVAGLALVVAACSQSPAPVEYRGQTPQGQSAPPPKPPPKPAAADASAGSRIVTVVRGDTVYGLSRRHGVPIRAIIGANGLRPPFMLRVGQRLRLPAPRHHVVKLGETVYALSRLYDVDMHSLIRINDIAPPYTLRVGRRLALPGTVVAVAAPPPARPSKPEVGQRPASPPAAPGARAVPPAGSVAIPAVPPRSSGRFAWPVKGTVISSFGAKPGGRHNDGINIQAAKGTPVLAAENGVVVYVGNELRGFGNLMLIRHAGGWMTAYAHNETLLARRGDTVRRGQAIARLGDTGNVSRPQLHFEIRRASKAVDPLRHLAARSAALPVRRAGRRASRQGPG